MLDDLCSYDGEISSPEQICEILKRRFENNIYGIWLRSILITINPNPSGSCTFTQPINGVSAGDVAQQALAMIQRPHIDWVNILLCGESGSGKTENAKQILKVLLPDDFCKGSSASYHFNMVTKFLESIGNAQTIHNANSSRFVTLTKVYPQSSSGHRVNIHTFLLAKGRLTRTLANETNFPVFYCALEDEKFCRDNNISSNVQDWHILKNGTTNKRHTKDEIDSMLEILMIDREAFWQTIRVVLLLGNLLDKPSPDYEHILNSVATCFSLDQGKLKQALDSVEVYGGVRRDYSAKEKILVIEGLIREIYESLFRFCTNQINDTLNGPTDGIVKTEKTISVLDIYGFETLVNDTGMIDQLLINYVNEVIHENFISKFQINLAEEFRKESIIDKDADFIGSEMAKEIRARVLNCKKALLTINDVINIKFDENKDLRFTQECLKLFNNKPNVKIKTLGFIVNHYARPVTYETEGMVDMACIFLKHELALILAESPLSSVLDIRVRQANANRSQATSFITTIDSLMNMLKHQRAIYIRTLKSTYRCVNEFDDGKVKTELMTSGIYDILRLLSKASAECCDITVLANSILQQLKLDKLPEPVPSMKDLVEACLALKGFGESCTVGFTKVFSSRLDDIIEHLSVGEVPAIEAIQSYYVSKIRRRRLTGVIGLVHFVCRLELMQKRKNEAASFIQTWWRFRMLVNLRRRAATIIQRAVHRKYERLLAIKEAQRLKAIKELEERERQRAELLKKQVEKRKSNEDRTHIVKSGGRKQTACDDGPTPSTINLSPPCVAPSEQGSLGLQIARLVSTVYNSKHYD